jgi:hypothetical protein
MEEVAMRKWLALGLIGFWSLAASVAACGGDDAASSSGAPQDGGGADAVGNNDGGPPESVSVVASDVTVYTGSLAALDASTTSATEFAWVVKSVPGGSAVTTQSLAGANTARPSFVADVSGEYVLEVTARSGGTSGTKSVRVKAVAAPLFFMQTNFGEDPPYFEYRTIGNDKSNNHPIACRINGEKGDAGAAGQFLFMSVFLADIGMDWWEAPPGSASHVAFTTFQLFADGGSNAFLALGSTETTCASPPAVVNHIVEDGGDPRSILIQPRYSPNGARVTFIDQRAAGYSIEAVSYDGNDRRALARFCSPDIDSCWAPAVFPPRPQWVDAQTVGWARARQEDGGNGWEVVLANDSANPNPRVHMTCDGAVPRSIAFLKDGSVIANRIAEGTQIEDLLVFKPSAPGGACQVVRNLTNLTTARSYARDFVVSPDESEVVFVRTVVPAGEPAPDGGGSRSGGELYVVPANGSSPPVPFGGSPQYAMFGARYVASASQIAWNGVIPFEAGVPDGSPLEAGAPALRVGPREGGTIQNLVVSDIDAGVYVIGGGNGGSCDFRLCSFAAGQASGGGALAAGGAALVFALRRKRRRSR